MQIQIQLTREPISAAQSMPAGVRGEAGAWVEFRGVVRAREQEQDIVALEYEAYDQMACSEMRRILQELEREHPCLAVSVVHRTGVVPIGETAIYVGVAARHRQPAFAMLTGFMDRLKQDVPIWKGSNPRFERQTTDEHG